MIGISFDEGGNKHIHEFISVKAPFVSLESCGSNNFSVRFTGFVVDDVQGFKWTIFMGFVRRFPGVLVDGFGDFWWK